MTIRIRQRGHVPRNRVKEIRVRNTAATNVALAAEVTNEETAVANAVVNAVVIAANPAIKKANALPAKSQGEATTATAVREPLPPVINERPRTGAETHAAKVIKGLNGAPVEIPSVQDKVIELTKVIELIKAAAIQIAAGSQPDDPSVRNHPRPQPGNHPQVRLKPPAQSPKTNQQKRNRCHIGNASPPCLD